MNLEERFDQAVEEWKGEVNLVSASNPVNVGCGAYRKILEMGKKALPLIRNLYEKTKDAPSSGSREDIELSSILLHGLPSLVAEITGENYIPKEIAGRIDELREYTINWLDENMGRYVC